MKKTCIVCGYEGESSEFVLAPKSLKVFCQDIYDCDLRAKTYVQPADRVRKPLPDVNPKDLP